MASRLQVQAVPDYPGLFYLTGDSGDIQIRQVLTFPQVEALRASINDAFAVDARRRRHL